MEGESQSNILKSNYPTINIGGVDFVIQTMDSDLQNLTATPQTKPIPTFTPIPVVTLPPSIKPSEPPTPPKPSESIISKPAVIPPPPKPKKEDKTAELLKAGHLLLRDKKYLDALEKFEDALKVATGWWSKWQIKRAIKRCRAELTAIEKQKAKEQQILANKLKAETERKLKEEKLASLAVMQAQEKAQKELAERQRIEQMAKLKAEREAAIKARQQAQLAEEEKIRRAAIEERLKAEQVKAIAEQERLREKALAEQARQDILKKQEEERQARLAAEAEARQARAEAEKQQVEAERDRQQAILKVKQETEQTHLQEEALAKQAKQIELTKRAKLVNQAKEGKQKSAIGWPVRKFNIAPLAIVILVLGSISLAIYWLNIQEKPEPIAPIEQPQIPKPLFTVDAQRIINFNKENVNKMDLISSLQILLEKEQTPANFSHIIFQKTIQNKTGYLLADDMLDFLNFSGVSVKNYMFFSYSQLDLPANPFLAGLGANRLGVILQFTDSRTARNLIENWGNNLINNLAPIILPQKPINNEALSTDNFSTAIYQNTAIFYLNLPDKYLSIDYAILGDKLIITTSKESMEAVIDRLLQ